MKHRPKIVLRVPSVARPGQEFDAEVTIRTKRDTKISGMEVWLFGEVQVLVPSSSSGHAPQRFLSLKARPLEETQLVAGDRTVLCRFTLPPQAPPSHDGNRIKCNYVIRVHLDIPWWFDRKETYVLVVAPPRASVAESDPTLHSARSDSDTSTGPHAEFSLAAGHFTPGSHISGQIALFNVLNNRYQQLKLSVLSMEGLAGQTAHEGARYGITFRTTELEEGKPMPFRMKLPEPLSPSVHAGPWLCSWWFEVHAKIGWQSDLTARVPIVILPSGSTVKTTVRRAPLTVGSDRLQQLWSSVASRTGLSFDGHVMRGEIDGVSFELGQEHRIEKGVVLVATVNYADLHLSSDGGLKRGFRRLLDRGIELGDAAWAKRHYLTGRDLQQISAFAKVLLPAIVPYTLADINDVSLQLEKRDAAQRRAPLEALAKALLVLARTLPRARAAIPPPASMTRAEPAWRKLAKRLDGTLETARMVITGSLDGQPATVTTEWSDDGEALATTITLDLGTPLDARKRLHRRGDTVLSGNPGNLGKRTQKLVDVIAAETLALDIGQSALGVVLPAPIFDADLLDTQLQRLTELAAALRGVAGPYR